VHVEYPVRPEPELPRGIVISLDQPIPNNGHHIVGDRALVFLADTEGVVYLNLTRPQLCILRDRISNALDAFAQLERRTVHDQPR
jgi:hypothetical protein